MDAKKTAGLAGVAAAAGAIGGHHLGNLVEPIKQVFHKDPSWHMNNADGSQSFTGTTEVLNQGIHDAVVGASTLTGAALMGAAGIAAGVYVARKNRNLGRQFNGR